VDEMQKADGGRERAEREERDVLVAGFVLSPEKSRSSTGAKTASFTSKSLVNALGERNRGFSAGSKAVVGSKRKGAMRAKGGAGLWRRGPWKGSDARRKEEELAVEVRRHASETCEGTMENSKSSYT
jgi:hypothetical protein